MLSSVPDDLSVYNATLDDAELSALSALAEETDVSNNWPAALASAAYGYTRNNQFSPFHAAIFGFFGLSYPLLSTLIFAFDALFIQDTPARRYAKEQLQQGYVAYKTKRAAR